MGSQPLRFQQVIFKHLLKNQYQTLETTQVCRLSKPIMISRFVVGCCGCCCGCCFWFGLVWFRLFVLFDRFVFCVLFLCCVCVCVCVCFVVVLLVCCLLFVVFCFLINCVWIQLNYFRIGARCPQGEIFFWKDSAFGWNRNIITAIASRWETDCGNKFGSRQFTGEIAELS